MRNQRTHIVSRLVLAGLALLVMLLLSAPSALASEGCPNEQLRQESDTNPTTAEPYDLSLPECRAYEMVSPLDKQQHDALLTRAQQYYLPASPAGDAVAWTSEGSFAAPENTQTPLGPENPYIAQRTAIGWSTRSAFPPITTLARLDATNVDPASVVLSPDLVNEAACGVSALRGSSGPRTACALRELEGTWLKTPDYSTLSGTDFNSAPVLVGASSDLSHEIFAVGATEHLLPSDTSSCTGLCGLYEVAGVGTGTAVLSQVNVDNNGLTIGPENPAVIGGESPQSGMASTSYQAVSADGARVFFTATPDGGVATVYARLNAKETVAISSQNPLQCSEACAASEARPAAYQGASKDGSKVFFTTTQPLVNKDTDATTDLYEYDFNRQPAERLIQVSGGGQGDVTPGIGAEVDGVVRVSEDGSRVYFVASGVLTSLPNGLGQTASQGARNLYGYDTESRETSFVATLTTRDSQLWGAVVNHGQATGNELLAQATPDGQYLVFDSYANLITVGPDADNSGAQQVYRYDFRNGELARVSISHDKFGDNGRGSDSVIASAAGRTFRGGALPDVNDINRAVSANGETIVFSTTGKLTELDDNQGTNTSCVVNIVTYAGCNVYEWHDGNVNLVSDGQAKEGARAPVISATGADIFFETPARLVAQDTDELGDIYDARIDGGFPAPTPEPSCSGEACQGAQSSSPTFGTPGSQSFTGGGNQTAPPFKEVLEPETKAKSKPLTKAQRLSKALHACGIDKGKLKRTRCERAARVKYETVKGKR
jgi:hypothetical protein